jgi:hypothetical protein
MAPRRAKASMKRETPPDPGNKKSPKKAYTAPRLVEYGSVAKLTQTGGVTVKDLGSMQRVCL